MSMDLANQRKMMSRIEDLQRLADQQLIMITRLEKVVQDLSQNGCAVTAKQASKKAA